MLKITSRFYCIIHYVHVKLRVKWLCVNSFFHLIRTQTVFMLCNMQLNPTAVALKL